MIQISQKTRARASERKRPQNLDKSRRQGAYRHLIVKRAV
jgi:hypothetical protein